MIQGITVQLINLIDTGETDSFGNPVYTEADPIPVGNVLFAPVSETDAVNSIDLSSVYTSYQLALPKGDTHTWENSYVVIDGTRYRVVGKPVKGIDALIPLSWNAKVTVELYE